MSIFKIADYLKEVEIPRKEALDILRDNDADLNPVECYFEENIDRHNQ